MTFDVQRIRQDFPCLHQEVRGRPLVYLDNAATGQSPQCVSDVMANFHLHHRANVHRGVHELSQRATKAYEQVRSKVQNLLGARQEKEIIFTSGTTESINLVADCWGRKNLGPGDGVLITQMEHHSNIVPWQISAERTGATVRHLPIDDDGDLILDDLDELLEQSKLLAVTHISNALGTINPVKELVRRAHGKGVLVLVDGAQAVPHLPIDVVDLDCDFYCFSGHKLFGPTGVGALYGKADLLNAMPPYKGGGDMIRTVTLQKSTWAPLPAKFEAGTPNIAAVIGLGTAIDYVNQLDWAEVVAYEQELLQYAEQAIADLPGLRRIGTARHRAGVLAFVLDYAHPHDIGTILDQEGVAIRTGHHCAQPVMDRYGIPATARASFAFYNTRDEVDALIKALHQVAKLFN